MSAGPTLSELVEEYERALAHTDRLWRDLPDTDVLWRASDESSSIGWHLGHQAAVAHFMIRNLTAAEPSPDPELEAVCDSATPEARRGAIDDLDRVARYRAAVADRVRARLTTIGAGDVAASAQMRMIATTLVTALVNHEYQHDLWISEVRAGLGHDVPDFPTGPNLAVLDGYTVIA